MPCLGGWTNERDSSYRVTSSDEGNIEVVVNLIFFSFLQDGDATRSLPLCNVICSGQLVVSPIANDLASSVCRVFCLKWHITCFHRAEEEIIVCIRALPCVPDCVQGGQGILSSTRDDRVGRNEQRYGSEVLYHRTETEARTQSQ